ncbi:hypothetical protein QUB36_18245 [Microcoleus sp. AT8-B1]|uniref:hypothetical protein n=1 Tax=unclassified Microcoleus TaxID=2642155 RepID=UPI002FD0C04F
MRSSNKITGDRPDFPKVRSPLSSQSAIALIFPKYDRPSLPQVQLNLTRQIQRN